MATGGIAEEYRQSQPDQPQEDRQCIGERTRLYRGVHKGGEEQNASEGKLGTSSPGNREAGAVVHRVITHARQCTRIQPDRLVC
jgi:hypothetical protein